MFKSKNGNILYGIATILLIIWGIFYIGGYQKGNVIHTLIIIALILIVLRISKGKKMENK